MAARGASVTGIDLSDKALGVARLHLLESGETVEYRKISSRSTGRRNAGAFDVVTCLEMLEHVPDPASTVRACAALVKPGGQVFFSTINRNPKAYLFAIIGAEYLLRLLPRGTHDYAKIHAAVRARPPLPRRWPPGDRDHRDDLQPIHANLFSW